MIIAAVSRLAALGCVGLLAWGLARYPLPVWPLATALLLCGVACWRWPAAWLIILPIVLPAVDLGMWTGWSTIGEADFFVLALLTVLLVRMKLEPRDLWPRGLPGAVLGSFVVLLLVAATIGAASPLGDTGLSGNPLLRPDNAWRLARGPLAAVLLLPFLRQRQRTHGDGASLLCLGIAIGLLAVTAEVLAERLLFAGVMDLATDYRVAGAFSSMNVGGGHIGAYIAMALPAGLALTLGLLPTRRRLLAALSVVGGTYALIVTFARTGYLAGVLGCAATCLILARTGWRRGGGARALAVIPVVLVVGAVAAAASLGVMRERLANAAYDLLIRSDNWQAGWAVRDRDISTVAIGMGLGTYQRSMLARGATHRPSDFGVAEDAAGRFVWVRMESPFYLGQKVALPATGSVWLTFQYRIDTPNAGIGWSLCDKILLYSDHCQSAQEPPLPPGAWQRASATLPVAALGGGRLGGLISRPVELSLFGTAYGSRFAFRDVQLLDAAGRSLLVNGDFRQGLDRWLFTDDSHVSWRMLNQYLMLLFETGVLGLAAWLTLAGLAIAGGLRAAARGESIGAAVTGSVVGFLVSGLFDHVLEAPRLAMLLVLIAGAGLLLWERQPGETRR